MLRNWYEWKFLLNFVFERDCGVCSGILKNFVKKIENGVKIKEVVKLNK